jgi:hypothetical protein
VVTTSEEVKQFIISVRRHAMKDESWHGASNKARIKLIIQLNKALRDPDNRVAVLAAITGLNITSQYNLTGYYTSVLIEETLDGKCNSIIGEIESNVEERNIPRPCDLYPWDRPRVYVPILSEAYNGP